MEPQGSKWSSVIKEGLDAFAKDPAYAIAIAQQGATLATQQATRASRILLSSAEPVASGV